MNEDPPERVDADYNELLRVEGLETLLEELEESGIDDRLDDAKLSSDLRGRAAAAGIRTLGELRSRIEDIHRRLDREGSAG